MKVKVVGVVVNKGTIQLYVEGSRPIHTPAEAWKVAVVRDKLVPALKKHKSVEFDPDTFDVEARFQDLTGGRVKLGWEKVKDFFGFRTKPQDNNTMERDAKIVEGITAETGLVYEQEKHAGHTYGVKRDPEQEHMVATVGDVRIPGVETMQAYMEDAVANGNAVGVEAFLKRIAEVIETRQHSVDELLNFMSMADLPLAEDGCIIAYKVLVKMDGYYVDGWSRTVTQKIGSLVFMDEELVDPSRRHECSSGFHIARKGYVRGANGNVCVLVKVPPEGVIAVPFNEPNKMRVREYHIISELPPEGYSLVKRNAPLTSNKKCAALLYDAIKGNHTPPHEMVLQLKGKGNVEVVAVDDAGAAIKKQKGYARALDDREHTDAVKEVQKAIDAENFEMSDQDLIDYQEEPDDQEYCRDCEEPIPNWMDRCEECQADFDDEQFEDVPDAVGEAGVDEQVQEEIDQQDEVEPAYTPPDHLVKEYAELSSAKRLALKMRVQGESQRAIEKATGVSRKAQWRLQNKGF